MTDTVSQTHIVERLRYVPFSKVAAHELQQEATDEIEKLREALIWADMKIRSYPGADQSDVEPIRAALA